MKVSLARYTSNPIHIMALVCRTCTGRAEELEPNPERIKKVLRSGHESIAEHVVFTFLIEGISRACSHQLVRYRHCSFSQLSQRYAKVGTRAEAHEAYYNYFYSEEVEKGLEILEKYFILPKSERLTIEIADIFLAYHEVMKRGVKPEDARAILPNCTKTDLLVTMNLREFMHICNERLCSRAQGEIRELVEKMRDLVLENLPELEEFLVPKCRKYGHCFEEKSCGLMPKMETENHEKLPIQNEN